MVRPSVKRRALRGPQPLDEVLADGSAEPPLGAATCSLREQGALAAGSGRLRVARSAGQSAVLSCCATSPLQLFTPRPRGEAVWAITSTHGGGLVAGDAVDLAIEVGPGAAAMLGTQGNTRVYRSSGRFASQRLTAGVAAEGVLAVLPEPTTCFAGARLRQEQRFALAGGGSLLLVDVVTEGRSARGERWAFDAYLAQNEIEVDGRLLLADAVRLVAGEGRPLAERMGGAAMLATVVALGPAMAEGAQRLLAEHAGPVDRGTDLTVAASPLADGVHLRLAAATVAAGTAFIRASVAFAGARLGGIPFDRRP